MLRRVGGEHRPPAGAGPPGDQAPELVTDLRDRRLVEPGDECLEVVKASSAQETADEARGAPFVPEELVDRGRVKGVGSQRLLDLDPEDDAVERRRVEAGSLGHDELAPVPQRGQVLDPGAPERRGATLEHRVGAGEVLEHRVLGAGQRLGRVELPGGTGPLEAVGEAGAPFGMEPGEELSRAGVVLAVPGRERGGPDDGRRCVVGELGLEAGVRDPRGGADQVVRGGDPTVPRQVPQAHRTTVGGDEPGYRHQALADAVQEVGGRAHGRAPRVSVAVVCRSRSARCQARCGSAGGGPAPAS